MSERRRQCGVIFNGKNLQSERKNIVRSDSEERETYVKRRTLFCGDGSILKL